MKVKKLALYLIFSGICVGVFVLCFIIGILSVNNSASKKNKIESSARFRLMEYDPLSGSVSFSKATAPERLMGDGFVSYENHGKHYLISDSETDSYFCSGTCTCIGEENDRRIANAGILSRSASFLVAAVSSLVAYNLAKDRFHSECVDRFKDYTLCEVRSEFGKCEEIDTSYWLKEEEDTEETLKNAKDFYWVCKGQCMQSPGLERKFLKMEPVAGFFKDKNCGKLELVDNIEVSATELFRERNYFRTYETLMPEFMKKRFMKRLDEFCRDNSKQEIELEQNEPKDGTKFKTSLILCKGSLYSADYNPSVECVPTKGTTVRT